jgi:hypothetical protein
MYRAMTKMYAHKNFFLLRFAKRTKLNRGITQRTTQVL